MPGYWWPLFHLFYSFSNTEKPFNLLPLSFHLYPLSFTFILETHMITYSTSTSASDLQGILSLQQQNLAVNLPPDEVLSQGFVTVTHRLEDLSRMNDIEAHVIAKDGEQVIGYLLAMTVQSKADFPVLIPMFELFERIQFRKKPVADYHYLVVGQVCVDKNYRGQGILDQCYEAYKNRFKDKYDFAITEIAIKNQRSIKAHNRIGFREIHRYNAPDGVEWSVVVWEW